MIQVIVAAHGNLAAELVNSSEMVFGEVEINRKEHRVNGCLTQYNYKCLYH